MSQFDQRGLLNYGSLQNIGTQINMPDLADSGGCPKCKKIDKVEKVSSVFSSGSHSLLSDRLAPPKKPEVKGVSVPGIFASLLLIGVPLINIIAASSNTGYFLTLSLLLSPVIIFGIILLVLNFRGAEKRKAEFHNSTVPQWNKAMTRWQNLYYCSRDDGVFNLEERVFIPVSQFHTYLFR